MPLLDFHVLFSQAAGGAGGRFLHKGYTKWKGLTNDRRITYSQKIWITCSDFDGNKRTRFGKPIGGLNLNQVDQTQA